jgi:hypothetical protein
LVWQADFRSTRPGLIESVFVFAGERVLRVDRERLIVRRERFIEIGLVL